MANTTKLCLNRLFGSGLISYNINAMLMTDIRAKLNKCSKVSLYGWLKDTITVRDNTKAELVDLCMEMNMSDLIRDFKYIDSYSKGDMFNEIYNNINRSFLKASECNLPDKYKRGYVHMDKRNICMIRILEDKSMKNWIIDINLNNIFESFDECQFGLFYDNCKCPSLKYEFGNIGAYYYLSHTRTKDLFNMMDIVTNIHDHNFIKKMCMLAFY